MLASELLLEDSGASDVHFPEELRVATFFSGVGMVELGLNDAWKCVFANDMSEEKSKMYRAYHRKSEHFHLGDIAQITANDIPAPIDLAWASFPCQDLSLAGGRLGLQEGSRSGTFWEFHRIMSELHRCGKRPPLIVLENVVGLLSSKDFPSLCRALSELNLRYGALVMDAKYFLPQSRPRVFIIAVDESIDLSLWELGSNPPSSWITRSVIAAYQRLPCELKANWAWWLIPEPSAPPRRITEIVGDEPSGIKWHTSDQTARLLALMSPAHLSRVEDRKADGARHIGFVHRRMRSGIQRAEVSFSETAGCLRTPIGGSSKQFVLIIEGNRVDSRLLSIGEAAGLMGIDPAPLLRATYNSAYAALGDGVAVPVVQWLAENLLTPIAKFVRASVFASSNSVETTG